MSTYDVIPFILGFIVCGIIDLIYKRFKKNKIQKSNNINAIDVVNPSKCRDCRNTKCKVVPIGGCNYDPRYVRV